MADRLHAMLPSHLRPEIEERRAFLPAGFRFQRQLRLVPTHHHHLLIDGPFTPRLAIPPYLNVGRFTAPTHHVYNLFPSPFLLFAYAAHSL